MPNTQQGKIHNVLNPIKKSPGMQRTQNVMPYEKKNQLTKTNRRGVGPLSHTSARSVTAGASAVRSITAGTLLRTSD